MIVGIPKEVKQHEYRVGVTPDGVRQLADKGHAVLVQAAAGDGSCINDDEYREAGARIAETITEIYAQADLIIKVKEPQPEEYLLLRPGQILYAFFHFAASEGLTKAVRDSGAVAIAYETMQTSDGNHPILTPMSEIAGKMAVQEGAKYLEKPMQGRGVLLGGVPGVTPAEVVIIGGGIVGTNAAKVAAGFGASVAVFDINLDRLRYLSDVMPANVTTHFCSKQSLRAKLLSADLVIGAVLVAGARAPVLVTEEMVMSMKRGAVVVDVAVDQGGCIATSRPTTHAEPIYVEHGVVHYGVTNMPGAVPQTSTFALCNANIGYAIEIADKGWRLAAAENNTIRGGINTCEKRITNKAVAKAFGMPYSEL